MKKIMASVISLCATAALQLPAGAQQHVETKELSFTFPAGFGPMEKKKTNTPGQLPMTLYEAASSSQETFIISKAVGTVAAKDATAAHNELVRGRDGMIKKMNAKLEKQNFFTYESYPALSFYTTFQFDNKTIFDRVLVVLKGAHLYMVQLLCADSPRRDSADVDAVFKSFKIK